MPLTLTVRFNSTEATDGSLIHRVRNFAEDLQRALTHEEVGRIEDTDAVVAAIVVIVESKRKLGNASALIKEALKRHKLDDQARLER